MHHVGLFSIERLNPLDDCRHIRVFAVNPGTADIEPPTPVRPVIFELDQLMMVVLRVVVFWIVRMVKTFLVPAGEAQRVERFLESLECLQSRVVIRVVIRLFGRQILQGSAQAKKCKPEENSSASDAMAKEMGHWTSRGERSCSGADGTGFRCRVDLTTGAQKIHEMIRI
jgi:hypothetical protein